MVLIDPLNTPSSQLEKYYSWRGSAELGGTPGAASGDRAGILINEVLSHTDLPDTDAIELFDKQHAATVRADEPDDEADRDQTQIGAPV